jgi:hypothetical protein
MCQEADAIVRVTALDYISPPTEEYITTGIPRSIVRMRVEDVISGEFSDTHLAVRGYLSNDDDFNDHPAPYQFVRPGGRGGSCYANTYRQKAQFVLFLKEVDGEVSPYWYALGPVNEQLTGEDDPWVWWLKGYLAGLASSFKEEDTE